MHRRHLVRIAVILAAFVFVRSAAAGQIPVGVCLSLTGESAPFGKSLLAGIELFVDDFNSRSSESGLAIKPVVRDDESDPARASAIVDEFADSGIHVVVGPVTSRIMLAMLGRARSRNVVLVSPTATSPRIRSSDGWAFKILPDDEAQGRALGKFFAQQMGALTAAAVINEDNQYGADILNSFMKKYEKNGGRVLAVERYSRDSSSPEEYDFSGIIASLRETDPEIVVLPGFAREAAAFIRQVGETDWNPIFVGPDAWLNTQVIYAAGDRLEDSYYVGWAEVYSNTPEAKRFVGLMEASKNPDLDTYSVNGYDAMQVVAAALRAGARAAWQIRDRLFTLKDYPLAAGRLTFDRASGTGKTLYIYRIGKSRAGFYSEVVAEVQPD